MTNGQESSALAGLARFVMRHRRLVAGVWIALTIFGAFAAGQVSKRWLEQFSIPCYSAYEANQRTLKIFGSGAQAPNIAVIRVKGEDEAIRIANDTEYGLSASVYTRDIRRGLAVAARIESGICHINGPTVGDEAQMPFGGVKGSGYGRFGGRAAIAEFTDLRWITIEDPQQHYPF